MSNIELIKLLKNKISNLERQIVAAENAVPSPDLFVRINTVLVAATKLAPEIEVLSSLLAVHSKACTKYENQFK